MCEGLGYDEMGIGRLRGEMRRNMGDEERKYQVFSAAVGRKAEREE
jgi:hypothetical protein